jgi:large subunit ribosomal protein L25
MKKHALTAQPRTLQGRKVKTLRAQGITPATVYGKNVKSTSIGIRTSDFLKVFDEVGESGLIELSLDGQVKPVLIHNVQKDPVSDAVLHAELRQVDLKEKVTATVPIVLTGVSFIVEQKKGVIITVRDEVDVEALPTDLPEKIEIDVSVLKEIDQEITVGELSVPKGAVIQTEKGLTVVKVGSLVSKEAEAEQAAQVAAAAAAEAAEVAPGGAEATQEVTPTQDQAGEQQPKAKIQPPDEKAT